MFDVWNASFSSLDLWGYLGFMVETRIALRHRVMKAGTIEFGSSAIDCMVRNLSIIGAALLASVRVVERVPPENRHRESGGRCNCDQPVDFNARAFRYSHKA
jgi:hypothetical protein